MKEEINWKNISIYLVTLVIVCVFSFGLISNPMLQYKVYLERINTVMSASDLCLENNKTFFVEFFNTTHFKGGCSGGIVIDNGTWYIIRQIGKK